MLRGVVDFFIVLPVGQDYHPIAPILTQCHPISPDFAKLTMCAEITCLSGFGIVFVISRALFC